MCFDALKEVLIRAGGGGKREDWYDEWYDVWYGVWYDVV